MQHTRLDSNFQTRVGLWVRACFGPEAAADREKRNHRFFEEATEFVQANGMTREDCHKLVDYTFSRPAGNPTREAGAALLTLGAACEASGLHMHLAGEAELERNWRNIEKIRAKQAAQPDGTPLPGVLPQTEVARG
jgi:anti-sigma factor RsiW